MKKFILLFVIFIIIILVMNYPVEYTIGINYKVSSIKIPLYAKLSGFFYRDWMYKSISSEIVSGKIKDIEKAIAIFNWVIENVSSKIPVGFKVIDDHPLNIIIRGYGKSDQLADIFTILCCYAGMDAGYSRIYSENKDASLNVAFVKINGMWFLFDVFGRYIFRDRKNQLVTLKTLVKEKLSDRKNIVGYNLFIKNIKLVEPKNFKRAKMQKPFNRFLNLF